MSWWGPFHIQTTTRGECRTGSQDNPGWAGNVQSRSMGPSTLLWSALSRWGGQELPCNACWEFFLFYVYMEWGTRHVHVGRYTCVCKCTCTNTCECEGQRLTLGVFVDWSLSCKLRQGLSTEHADLVRQASFGHPCLCLPSVGIISRSLCLSSISVGAGTKLWSSCICDKCITCWALSLALLLFYILLINI